MARQCSPASAKGARAGVASGGGLRPERPGRYGASCPERSIVLAASAVAAQRLRTEFTQDVSRRRRCTVRGSLARRSGGANAGSQVAHAGTPWPDLSAGTFVLVLLLGVLLPDMLVPDALASAHSRVRAGSKPAFCRVTVFDRTDPARIRLGPGSGDVKRYLPKAGSKPAFCRVRAGFLTTRFFVQKSGPERPEGWGRGSLKVRRAMTRRRPRTELIVQPGTQRRGRRAKAQRTATSVLRSPVASAIPHRQRPVALAAKTLGAIPAAFVQETATLRPGVGRGPPRVRARWRARSISRPARPRPRWCSRPGPP
jgi:hypothetical protein